MLKEWLAPLLEWFGFSLIELLVLIIAIILLIKWLTE